MVNFLGVVVILTFICSVLFLILSISNLNKHFDVKYSSYKPLDLKEYLNRAEYSVFKLSVALISVNGPEKILLFKQESGEFEGYWGFPAGYVKPKSEEYDYPLKKANDKIKEYFGFDSDGIELENYMEYKYSPTKSKRLWLDYSNIPKVDTNIYEYFLKDTNIIKSPKENWCVFDYSKDKLNQEIKKFNGNGRLLNPFVLQVLTKYKKVDFPKYFVEKTYDLINKRVKTKKEIIAMTS